MDSAPKLRSTVREGTLEETSLKKLPEFATLVWCGVIEEDGNVVGQVMCSEIFGEHWLHDLEHHGTDRTAVKRLTRLWQERLPALGVKTIRGEYNDQRQVEIALADGWELQSILLRRDL